jgi:uncharacterized peroxidase-related enzyme
MSYIDTISLEEATGDVREMYERQQGAWGYVPNYAKSFSHRPEVMARWGKLLAELQRPMDKRRLEMITFAAAHELKHSSCSLAHGNALTPFFTNAEICAIAEGRAVESITEAEQEMMRFARLVARDASTVDASDVERLKDRGFSDAEVFDIAAVAAGRAFFTKILDAVGSLPDAGFMSLDEDLRAPLTVGRPISAEKDEVMNSLSD